jgi:PPOX class probable F420-dependent enzyme
MTDSLQQFEGQQYLVIETYRKNGQGVKTPVWFARDGDTLRVWTESGSGKARRIRRDGRIRLAPSTGSGQPLGAWADAHAVADDSPEALDHVFKLFKKKYGVAFDGFRLLGKMRSATYITLTIRLD